ncbi:hypothetical protein PVK06_003136 [Gossypium arboreum]|uniref:RNase H type-1 domain-containing protein n=1 Tax=Gossypium arboreum TaxID=29729 RepID=A0ABR0R5K1_GOSAR|nr:hypothetical protein PVK06_003136 [Gossypium arboreum]
MAEYKGIKVKTTLSHTVQNQRNVEDLLIVKIQFDATFNNRKFIPVSGLVVRGLMNEVLALKSIIHRNVASPFAAEAFAWLEAIKLDIEMGLQEIQIMGDSLTVIKKYHSTATDYSIIGTIIRDIQCKKPYFQKIEFKHIQKTKNTKAHNTTEEALQNSERNYLENEEPIHCDMRAKEQ